MQTERRAEAPASRAAEGAPLEEMFAGDGEMARLMRATDWSRTPLGPVETWSPSLRMMVRFLLPNRFPLLLWWGPEFLQLYNDAYRPVLGTKHPQYLGRPVRECWSEIWDVIGPLIETPFSGGPATWMEDIQLEVNRHGFVEETHFTIGYSPVPDETAPNGIGGVMATVHEISEKVIGERRVVALRDLGARSTEAKTADEACQIAAEILSLHSKDIPFALLYLIDPDGQHARLAATAGAERDSPLCPPVLNLRAEPAAGARGGAVWPLAEVARGETLRAVDDLASRFEVVPPGPWSDPPTRAVVAPIRSNTAHQLAGLLVAGVSARLQLDDTYAGFYDLVSGQIATAIANARAYEEERRRAETLAELDRAKTAFFSNVSHEFRTPLSLLLGPVADAVAEADASAAKGDAAAARQRERLLVAQRNGLRLLKLVNSLLDFSRIEAGRVRAAYAPVDLAALTADLASAFRSLVERAGLRFVVDCPPLPAAIAPVYVDREMWEKVVLNLLSNAFKFTFEGEIAVSLRAEGNAAILTVRDTGTGISAEEMPHIFERFHRVDGARSRTYEGTGIGLALVRELVRLHGGEVAVESAVGAGTTFTVRIPAGAAHLPAGRVQAGPEPTSTEPASTGPGAVPLVEEAARWLPDAEEVALAPRVDGAPLVGEGAQRAAVATTRIVVADDNADMRDYLARLLGERYEVVTAPDGERALQEARARRPNLVLTDVMMPRLDGFGLVRALKADPATAGIPVIALSARAGEEATVEGLQMGADDYLVKPFSARELMARVAAHLEMARLRAEAQARARELETMFEAIADAVFIYDGERRIARMNSAARTLLGLDAYPAYPDYDDLSPEQRAMLIAVRDERGREIPAEESGLYRLLGGEALTGANATDVRLRLADGRELEVNIAGAPLRDETGVVVGAIAVSRDVTEHRRQERAVVERARELEAIFEAAADGLVIYDETGRLRQWNAAVAEMFEFEQMPDYAGLPADDRPARLQIRDGRGRRVASEDLPFMRAIRGEVLTGEHAVDLIVTTPSGREKYVSATAAPLRDARGQTVGSVTLYRDVTERRRLERSARWQAGMLERAHDAIFMWEIGGNIIYWNRGAELLYGFTKDEAVGRVSHDLLHTRRPGGTVAFEEALARDGEWTGELTHTTRDGREVVVLSRHQVLVEPDGRRYVLETSRDITERRRLEREVRASEERLRAILELLPVGVAFVDASGKAVIVNQAVKAILGEDAHIAESREDFGVYHAWRAKTGEPVAPEEWGLARALATGEVTLAEELDIQAYDGMRKTVLNSNAPLRDEMGAIVGGMSVLVDVTERKRLERRVQEALTALMGMAEALAGGAVTASGGHDHARAAAPGAAGAQGASDSSTGPDALGAARRTIRQLLGLTQRVMDAQYAGASFIDSETGAFDLLSVVGLTAEIERRLWRDLANRRMGDYYPPEVLERLNAEEMVAFDFAADPLISGQDYCGLRNVLIVPSRLDAQRLLVVAVEARDRPAFTSQERDLAQAALRLVRLAIERERLLRERAEAEGHALALGEANRRMDEFLGIASHELRTPLTSLTANVQIAERQLDALERTPDSSTVAEMREKAARAHTLIERTGRQAARLDRLIGDLLDVSRIQAGKLDLRPEPCDLLALVRDVAEGTRAAWPTRSITLDLSRRPEVPLVADADRIEQVLVNYLTNALKYSAGDRPVSVRMRLRDGMARVEVRDQGPGLTPEQRERIWERFHRVPGIAQRSGSGVGLGLGLYISREIVERHGGAVGLESAPGEGSTFWFTLPLEESDGA